MNITREQVIRASTDKNDPWVFGNNVLYTLCREYPLHVEPDVVIAKVWLIGRTYAAAIERRRISDKLSSDEFYIKKVAPELRKSSIDEKIAKLASSNQNIENHLEEILHLHWYLTSIFCKISGNNKRSLASKYLHFHLPELFFIYDTRAYQALNSLTKKYSSASKLHGEFDQEYQQFYVRALNLRDSLQDQYDIHLSPRQLDTLLLSL